MTAETEERGQVWKGGSSGSEEVIPVYRSVKKRRLKERGKRKWRIVEMVKFPVWSATRGGSWRRDKRKTVHYRYHESNSPRKGNMHSIGNQPNNGIEVVKCTFLKEKL
jgi:hypothetical protein